MKFNNVVAYCKGFYVARPGDVPEMWKDIAHCIICDGWTIFDKKDVARWCLFRLEDFSKEFPNEAWKVSFGTFYSKIENNKEIVKASKMFNRNCIEPDEYDYIIWTFRDFIRYLDGDKFTEGVIPNDAVLSVDRENISDTLWKEILCKYEVQDTNTWYWHTFDERESKLKG